MIFEKSIRFGKSRLWKWQEEAYCVLGPEAWSKGGVPFYLTANPLVAHHFADWVEAFLQGREGPIDLIDLGAGSGRFAYLFLSDFLGRGCCQRQCVRYVMTDIAEKNRKFWRQHRLLEPFFREGILDTAYFHHEGSDVLVLEGSGETVRSFEEPPIVVANYFFDTIPQSLYRLSDGECWEARVTLEGEGDMNRFDSDFLSTLRIETVYERVNPLQCGKREGGILAKYCQEEREGFVTMPTGAFSVLDCLMRWTGGNFLLLASDQGWASSEEWKRGSEPLIDRHSTFSLRVNYDALYRDVVDRGGQGWLISSGDGGFVQGAFLYGDKREKAVFNRIWQEGVATFSVWDYWHLVESLPPKLSQEAIYHLLQMGRGDPQNLYHYFSVLNQELAGATEVEKKKWRAMLDTVESHFYPMTEAEEVFVQDLQTLIRQI